MKNKMEWPNSTYAEEEIHTMLWWGNLRDIDHL
jgi:hypothetical protein